MKLGQYLIGITALFSILFTGCDSATKEKEDTVENEISYGADFMADTAMGVFFRSGTNSTRFEGDTMGLATEQTEVLRKPVKISVLLAHSDLEVGVPYAVLEKSGDSRVQLVIPVKNISMSTVCVLSIVDLLYKDDQDQELSADESVSLVGGTLFTPAGLGSDYSSCLIPGEIGYVFDSETVEFTALSSVSIAEIEAFRTDGYAYETPDSQVIPSLLSVDSAGTFVSVTIENNGVETLDVSYVNYILLDTNGFPLYVGDLSDGSWNGELAAGSTHPVSSTIDYTGSATAVRVIVEYQRCGKPGASC